MLIMNILQNFNSISPLKESRSNRKGLGSKEHTQQRSVFPYYWGADPPPPHAPRGLQLDSQSQGRARTEQRSFLPPWYTASGDSFTTALNQPALADRLQQHWQTKEAHNLSPTALAGRPTPASTDSVSRISRGRQPRHQCEFCEASRRDGQRDPAAPIQPARRRRGSCDALDVGLILEVDGDPGESGRVGDAEESGRVGNAEESGRVGIAEESGRVGDAEESGRVGDAEESGRVLETRKKVGVLETGN